MRNLLEATPWLATFFCMIFSFRLATTFLRANPRMFTVMALFACAWGLLLPYYHERTISVSAELFAAYSGFLFVYVGGLLMLQSRTDDDRQAHDVVPWQVFAVYLLLVIAAPTFPTIITPDLIKVFQLSREQTYLLLGTVLDLTGFFVIALGARTLLGRSGFGLLAAILICYGALDIGYTLHALATRESTQAFSEMSEFFRLSFAAAKVAFAITFGCLVAHYGMPEETRSKGFPHWAGRYFGLV